MFRDGTRKYNTIKHPTKLVISILLVCIYGLKYVDFINNL